MKSLKDYLVRLEFYVDAYDEEDAIGRFWERIDDSDYPAEPIVVRQRKEI